MFESLRSGAQPSSIAPQGQKAIVVGGSGQGNVPAAGLGGLGGGGIGGGLGGNPPGTPTQFGAMPNLTGSTTPAASRPRDRRRDISPRAVPGKRP